MQEELTTILETAVEQQVFPGAVLAYIKDGERHTLPVGRLKYDETAPAVRDETVYDVASITKSIPVTAIILSLIEQKRLSLESQVVDYLPELQTNYRQQIQVKHLLTYTTIFDLPSGLATYARKSAKAAMQAIFTAPLVAPPGEKYLYNNSPAILLGLIAERVCDKTLDSIADERFFQPLGMHHTTFHPERLLNADIAPTEIDWRGEVHGVVHDETAWALRGAGSIAGNAGLFTTATDLLTFGEMLLAGGVYQGKRFFSEQMISAMHTNQIEELGESTGLGWELNQRRFMGGMASTSTFGKTGFTGSIILIDPGKQAMFVLLSNRTYPQRPTSREGINDVRCAVADIIFG